MSSQLSKSFCFEVSSQEHGKRLLQFLRDRLEGKFSVKAIKRAIESKKCTVNEKLVNFSTTILAAKDRVIIDLQEDKEEKPLTLRLLYEDDWVLAFDKSPGVVCEAGTIASYLPPQYKKAHLIHRLDKETSGVLLFAKDENTLKEFIERFRGKEISKVYHAIVEGLLQKEKGEIHNLLEVKAKFSGQTIYGASTHGKEAITKWKCLKKGKDASLVECLPITGRTHQLRVHLSEMGYPILGDVQYSKASASSYKPQRHLLHASEIRFVHPITHKSIVIKAPFPKDFETALKDLELM